VGVLKRIVIFILAAVAIAAGVWLAGSRLMGAPESKENSVRWPFGLGTIDEVPARFPKSPNDATADRVNSIGRRLAPADQTLRPAIQSYLSKAVAQSNDHVEAPPAAIRHFLDEHVAAIDELRTTLTGGASPPRWAIDISQDSPHPLVDLTAQMSLFRALATDAFDHHNRGDDTTAWRDAEAGWTLAQGLWAQPDLFSRMIALSGTRMMNAVAAKLSTPAPAWHGELLAFDADRAFAAAMEFNAWRAMTSWQRALPPRSPADDGNPLWLGAAGAIVRNVKRATRREICGIHARIGGRDCTAVLVPRRAISRKRRRRNCSSFPPQPFSHRARSGHESDGAERTAPPFRRMAGSNARYWQVCLRGGFVALST